MAKIKDTKVSKSTKNASKKRMAYRSPEFDDFEREEENPGDMVPTMIGGYVVMARRDGM